MRNKIKDSKIAKEALRRLVKRHKKVFDSLASGRQEELICSEACKHCDPFNSFCWYLWKYIRPYDRCHAGFVINEDGFIVAPSGDQE